MNPSEELFQLIKSMRMSEKKYFKMHVSGTKQKEKDYVKLFDAIDKQKQYDEPGLKKRLAKEPLLKRLPATKNYLFHAILKHVVSYRQQTTVENKIRMMHDYAGVLLEKGLLKQSEKFLAKARKMAETEELFAVYLDLLSLERKKLYRKLHDEPEKFRNKIEALSQKTSEVLSIMDNRNICLNFAEQILACHALYFIARDQKALNEYNRIIKDSAVPDEKNLLSTRARFDYYTGLGIYYRMIGDQTQAYIIHKKQVDLIESLLSDQTPEFVHEKYPVALRSLIIVQFGVGYYNEAEDYINRLRKILHDDSYGFVHYGLILQSYISLALSLFTVCGRFDEGIELIREVEERYFARAFSGRGRRDLPHFYYYSASVYVGKGDFRKALANINKVLHEESNVAAELYSFSRILNLIIHYELHNDSGLPHLIVSTYRNMAKKDRLYKTESAILRFLHKLSNDTTREDRMNLFRSLHTELILLQDDPYEERVLASYFDIISWLESKIENRLFAEIVREKAATRMAKEKQAKQDRKI